MNSSTSVPKLRTDLQIDSIRYQGENAYAIQDHLGLVPNGIVLRKEYMMILLTLNQSMNMEELQFNLIRMQGGSFISQEEIRSLIHQFDELYLLNTPQFQIRKQDIIRGFSDSPVRPAAFAGKSYPDNPDELRKYIGRIMQLGAFQDLGDLKSHTIKAIVAPHIDIRIGSMEYGKAYNCWPEQDVQRILLLGTGHHLSQSYFSISTKDYETPLGILRNDRASVSYLKSLMGGALAADDFAHKTEHSLEFQSLFIRYILGDRDVPCIPVLCGAFSSFLDQVYRPADFLQISGFLGGLSTIAQDPGTLIVVGVDLSHTGRKFGDDLPAHQSEDRTREHDHLLLQALSEGNIQKFWREARRARDQFHVCGLSALSTLLEICTNLRGHILNYELWHEEATQSAVGYAAAVLWVDDDDKTDYKLGETAEYLYYRKRD